MSINSQRKHLFYGHKVVKQNVLGSRLANLLSLGHHHCATRMTNHPGLLLPFQISQGHTLTEGGSPLLATSLSQCQTVTVASNESISPSSPPWKRMLSVKCHKVEASFSQAVLVNRKQGYHSSPGN